MILNEFKIAAKGLSGGFFIGWFLNTIDLSVLLYTFLVCGVVYGILFMGALFYGKNRIDVH